MSTTWQERLWAKCVPDDNGCWVWAAGRVPKNGYPIFYGPAELTRTGMSRFAGAHRWAYIAEHGAIPAGLEIDHLCNVRRCINPAHLDAVTHAENVRRAVLRRRHGIARPELAARRVDWAAFIAAT